MKIEYYITIHRESSPYQLQLLQRTIINAKNQVNRFGKKFDCLKILVVGDEDTPKALWNFVKRLDVETRCTEAYHWVEQKLEFMYNQSRADYIFFSASDDPPFVNRVAVQMESFMDHPACAVSLAGFVFHDGQIKENNWFKEAESGFNVGYPSGWALNRNLLPQLHWSPILKEFAVYEQDTMLLCQLRIQYSMVIIKRALFEYTMHAANFTSQCPVEIKQMLYRKICDAWKGMKPNAKELITIE